MCEAKTGTERDIPGKTENKNKQKNCGVQKRPSNCLYHVKTNFEILSVGPMAVKYVNIFMGEEIKNSLEYYYKFSLSLILLTDTYNIYIGRMFGQERMQHNLRRNS